MPPKRKKKMLVIKYDEPKIPAGHVRGDDGKIRRKKLVIKYAQPLQNVSANASALSASAPSSTSRMEFPDDILSLVNQFAKPIKDRGLIRTNPSKWTKVDKSNFLGYLSWEGFEFANAPIDEDGPQFDMESEYFDENMEAYYEIHDKNLIETLLNEGSTGKLDGKTYRELANILEDRGVYNTYFNLYTGKPFDDQLRARFERDEDNKANKANARIKKKWLKQTARAIDTFIPYKSAGEARDRIIAKFGGLETRGAQEGLMQFASVSKKMLTVKIKNEDDFDKIKKAFVLEEGTRAENILDVLVEHIYEALGERDDEELSNLEYEDTVDIENKTEEFISIFIKRLVNDMLKESVPLDEMLRSVYWLYKASDVFDTDEDIGGETNYSKTMDVRSDFEYSAF